MRYLYGGVSILLLMACSRPESLPVKDMQNHAGPQIVVDEGSTSVDSITLSASFQVTDLSNARNIGEFFDHRLRFYKIDNPSLKINHTPVEELVLYFIDSTLAKMRYKVNDEVGSFLLDSLGMSRFKPLDSISRALIKEKQVYDRLTHRLNPELRDYELIWRNNISVRRYRVKTYDSLTKHYYFEEMYGYKKKVRELETIYNYLEESIPVLD